MPVVAQRPNWTTIVPALERYPIVRETHRKEQSYVHDGTTFAAAISSVTFRSQTSLAPEIVDV